LSAVNGSCRCFRAAITIRRLLVDTLSMSFGSQFVVPTTVPQPRHPPWLLTGSLGMVTLLSIATMEMLRLPLPVSRAFALRSASDTPELLPLSWRSRAESSPAASDLGQPVWSVIRLLFSPWRQEALPASLETPLPLCPALRPRADLHARPLRRFSVAPAIITTKAPPCYRISRLYHTASRLAAYA
jgi:hypothetical protein